MRLTIHIWVYDVDVDLDVTEGRKKEMSPRRVSTRFNLGVENERVDAGRDGQTCIARPNLRHERRQGKHIFPVQLITSRIGN